MLLIQEAKLSNTAGHTGHFCVDSIFTNRDIELVPELNVRLDAEEISRDNPAFDIEIRDNSIHYQRKENTPEGPTTIQFTAYFDHPVRWLALR